MKRTLNRLALSCGVALLTMVQGAGAAINVSQVPLFIATGVTPNVMLIVDNSGSMDNLMWPEAYDPGFAYPDWSPLVDHDNNGATPLQEAWIPTNGNILLSTLLNGRWRGTAGTPATGDSCPANWVRGRNDDGTITKCLRMPEPMAGNTRFTGNYLNYLFETYDHNTDLRGGQIPANTRMQVARSVAANIVVDNSNLRLGVASFNPPTGGDPGPGGRINAACGSPTATLLTQINALTANSNTPLAETYYEVTRYFRGLSSFYNAGVSYTSPIQYRCQNNYVVVITDGFPTRDNTFPNNDPADLADPTRSLPNWDGLAPVTLPTQYPEFPQYSDGFQPAGTEAAEGFTLYLDDLAKFGHDIDLRIGGTDLTGTSFDAPDHPQQRLITYTVGFAIGNQMLADAAEYGDGLYLLANTEDQLTDVLQAALADIAARESSASSVATNSTRLESDTKIYQARFSSKDWSGRFWAYAINGDGTLGGVAWDAANLIPAPNSRNIVTYDPGAALGSRGRQFLWGNLTGAQQSLLDLDVNGDADGLGEKRMEYLRGDTAMELRNGGIFRDRGTLLGDIINSDPLFVGAQDYGFDRLPGAEGSSYRPFRDNNRLRRKMVYVAANDGMLHGFDAVDGNELLAYMPDAVYDNLRYLTHESFNANHRLLNDGGPRSQDAYLGGSWKTVLLGGLGGGGRAIYALDVTDPDAFGTGNVMWEFTSANDSDLGLTIPQPTIARLANGKWAALIANGYNSTSERAVLFIIDLETGAVIRKLDTLVGGDNGLSSPTPVDVDGDRITDYVYAGDLQGNMWKFDLSSANPADWKVAFQVSGAPAPLYTACSGDPCTAGNRQAITARPEVGVNPPVGFYVYFGTGRYFAVGDNTPGGPVQTFYGIKDRNDKDSTVQVLPDPGRGNLVQQSVILEDTFTFLDADADDPVPYVEGVRVVTKNVVPESADGWYLNLPTAGERQVSTPILRAGRIIFTTLIPSGDACRAGGDSWLMELDALTGGRLDASPFDLNRDGEFNEEDFVTIMEDGVEKKVPVSGRKSLEGIIKTPGIITGPDGRIEYKYASGSSGGIDTTIENAGLQRGRQSWRQIQ